MLPAVCDLPGCMRRLHHFTDAQSSDTLKASLWTPSHRPSPRDHPTEHLTGAVERVTFHSEETGFCVLRVKVRGHRDLVTIVGTAATITPGEYI